MPFTMLLTDTVLESYELLTDILRGGVGFQGMDYNRLVDMWRAL